jgi:large subunit ribosomal protein L9
MKVILIKDKNNLGLAGDVVKVAPGYARNYLIPKEFVIPASKGNLHRITKIKEKAERERIILKNENKILAENIENKVLVFQRKADENGHLYGSVAENDIVKELANQGISIHRTNVKMEKHIKELGENEVEIDLTNDVLAHVKVKVEQE